MANNDTFIITTGSISSAVPLEKNSKHEPKSTLEKSTSSILNKLPIILKMAKESGGHVLLTEEGISVKFE